MSSEKIKTLLYVAGVFLLLTYVSVNFKQPVENTGFAPDPRDATKKIYIDKSRNQYEYLEEYGTEKETGEILHSIQIIGRQ